MDRQFPQAKGWFTSKIAPLRAQVAGETRRPLLLMLGAVGIVLLIACSNVANLLLTRSIARARELSLRAALGASNERLVAQLVTESVLLSIAGGAAGVFIALAGIRCARMFGPANIPRLADVTLDLPVLAFALGASMVTGLLFGLVPAFTAVRGADAHALKEGSLRSTAGTRSTRVRNALLVAEVALALVLVIASGLLARTFVHLLHVDAGLRSGARGHVRDDATASPLRRPRSHRRALSKGARTPAGASRRSGGRDRRNGADGRRRRKHRRENCRPRDVARPGAALRELHDRVARLSSAPSARRCCAAAISMKPTRPTRCRSRSSIARWPRSSGRGRTL